MVGYAFSAQIESDTSISNTGAITGKQSVGGLVGQAYFGTKVIAHEGILNSGAVTATSGGNVGGVIGYVDSVSIQADEDIINTGKISSMGSNTFMGAGGLIGYGQGVSVISQNGMLQNKGEVTAAITGVGGIAGYLTSSNDNYRIQAAKGMINTGRITGQKTVGGLVGEYACAVPMTSTDGFLLNTGDVEGNGDNVGGVIGRMAATLDSGKYGNTGNVTNTGKYTGGVIGSWDNNKTSLENAFNTGNVVVTGEDAADVGGIAGRFTGVNIKNCYHTTEYPLIGNGEAEKDKITGKISNCYCMEKNTLPWDGEITKTTKAFTDGEVAYLLDGNGDSRNSKLLWGQKIGTDQTPVLGGMTVYQDGSIYSNADGHHYGAPQYTWSESDMSCTARRICEGCENEESETVTASYTEEKAGCETNGKKEYKAEFKNPSFEVQTKTIMTDSLGHDVTDAVWSKDEKAHWKDCKNGCGKKLEQAEHTFQTIIDRQATESTEGSSHEECSVCGYQKAAVVIPVTGKEETINKQPSDTNTLTVGQVVVNKADGAFYTIKKNAGKVHEVEYKAPKNKKQKKTAVPDSIKINGVTYKVTSIAKSAFKNNKKLKTVTIGKNVSKIGENVFSGCKKLKTITIKSTKLKAKTLSKSTFKGITKATTVKVPKKKLSAYKKLFKSRGLSSKVKVKAY